MARHPMRMVRLSGAVALVGNLALSDALAVEANDAANSQSTEVAQAAIEIEKRAQNAGAESPDVTASSTSAAEPARAGNPLWAIPVSKLSATRDRPLFSSSRRPPPPTVAVAPEPPPPALVKPTMPAAPPFTLVGTIIGENNRIGIFRNESSKTATRIREGERDSGWTLRSVDPRSAVLEGAGQMVTLDLPEPSAAGGSVDSAQPGGSALRISGVVKKRNAARDNADGL